MRDARRLGLVLGVPLGRGDGARLLKASLGGPQVKPWNIETCCSFGGGAGVIGLMSLVDIPTDDWKKAEKSNPPAPPSEEPDCSSSVGRFKIGVAFCAAGLASGTARSGGGGSKRG